MNDIVLTLTLVYSAVDLHLEWTHFSDCRHPIHVWLLVSYASIFLFRCANLVGANAAPAEAVAGNFLLDVRQKGALPRTMASLTWFVCLPFMVAWTFLGTMWLWRITYETPLCIPTSAHMWFTIFWIALCYVWIIIHGAIAVAAWTLERRVRLAEGNLAQMEDADVLARWGQVSQLSGHQALGANPHKGLTPHEIAALPTVTLGADYFGREAIECSICLNELECGDHIRGLSVCGHTFHRSCIDLWLLRQAFCPLCKGEVKALTDSRG